MAGVNRSRRARLSRIFALSGMLLGLGALTATGLERISCGHQHLAGGHSSYHRHLFFAAHEHHAAVGHRHKAPAPHRPEAPRKPTAATVAPASALFQPTGARVLLAPPALSEAVVHARPLPGMAPPEIRPARPRGPPVEKGRPGCRT